MIVLLSQTDWTGIENVLAGLGTFVIVMTIAYGVYKLMKDDVF